MEIVEPESMLASKPFAVDLRVGAQLLQRVRERLVFAIDELAAALEDHDARAGLGEAGGTYPGTVAGPHHDHVDVTVQVIELAIWIRQRHGYLPPVPDGSTAASMPAAVRCRSSAPV